MPRVPRVIADVALLEDCADEIERLHPTRNHRLAELVDALDTFFASGSGYGPDSSEIPDALRRLFAETEIDAIGLLATAFAFTEAETALLTGLLGAWVPDDAWVEYRRRAWLVTHHPEAAGAAAPVVSPTELVRRLRHVDRQILRMAGGGHLSSAATTQLLRQREALLSDALVHIDALGDSLRAWSGSDNDPILDGFLSARGDLVQALVDGDPVAGASMTNLLLRGVPAGQALPAALSEALYERRLAEVMDAHGLHRSAAVDVVRNIDVQISALIEAGHSPEAAVVAFAMADHLGLDPALASELSANSGTPIIDVLGRMATAKALDLDPEGLDALDGLVADFAAFDSARGGKTDDKVSAEDLQFVVDNPHRFVPSQVIAARAILDEPILLNRLDTASRNGDVLDGVQFGDTSPGDRLISRDDIDAFLIRSRLNHLLGDHRVGLDTGARGGTPDGFFSRSDLTSWLEDNPDAPLELRDGVQYMIDAGVFDRSWLEANRDALAMGAAVAGGGVVIVVTGGTATPLVMAGGGLVAGGAAAGLTTIGVNHLTGERLDDGVLGNAIDGGLVGMTVAGLPQAWTNAAAITSGLTMDTGLAVTRLAGEVGGIVGSGGIDIVLPRDWEDGAHRGGNAVSAVSGLIAFGSGSARWVISADGTPVPAPANN